MLYLRPGTREHFLEALARDWPELLPDYERLYAGRAYLPSSETEPVRGGRPRARAEHVAAAATDDQARPAARAARARCVAPREGVQPRLVESRLVAENGEITVLIADDHEVVREGLRLALLRSPHIRVVGEAPDGETAVALAERRRPDVVIMDLRMPQMDGIEATEEIVARVPDTRVLVFTAYSERALLQRGLESGRARLRPEGGAARDAAQGDREGRSRARRSSTRR